MDKMNAKEQKKNERQPLIYYCKYLLVTAIRIAEVLFSQQMISSILREETKK